MLADFHCLRKLASQVAAFCRKDIPMHLISSIRSAVLLVPLSLFLICTPLPAGAVFSIEFGDFNSPAPAALSRNGDAALIGNVLRLTPDAQHKRGSSFLNIPFDFGPDTS